MNIRISAYRHFPPNPIYVYQWQWSNFNEARTQKEAQTTLNHTIGIMASVKSMTKTPPLTPANKDLCVEWS